jgi:simple sugar transport system substrate-binding protein
MRKNILYLALLTAILVLVMAACGPKPTETPTEVQPEPTEEPTEEAQPTEEPIAEPEEFVFGMLLVGPYNDRGWSQAHYEAGLYVEEKLPGARMIYIDKVNSADRPGTTPEQLADELVAQGAKLVIFNSDDMKDASTTFAQANPDIYVVMASGDQIWADGNDYIPMDNLTNIMGRLEYG